MAVDHDRAGGAAPLAEVNSLAGQADLEPPIGAHLVAPRCGYEHHGIYSGA